MVKIFYQRCVSTGKADSFKHGSTASITHVRVSLSNVVSVKNVFFFALRANCYTVGPKRVFLVQFKQILMTVAAAYLFLAHRATKCYRTNVMGAPPSFPFSVLYVANILSRERVRPVVFEFPSSEIVLHVVLHFLYIQMLAKILHGENRLPVNN